MSVKMGRPLSDNPRRYVVSCKLTKSEIQRLDEYCIKNNMSKSQVLKKSISSIIDPMSESK